MTKRMKAPWASLALLSLLTVSGCSTVNQLTGQTESIQYKSTVTGDPLSIPPDLTQPNADTHYKAPEGTATLSAYLDGRRDATAKGLDSSISLANGGDLHVGGTDRGRHLDGTLDFLRIAQGTLADADTTIEELYAWEFDGPHLRDFAGTKPRGARRDAGALEKTD